MLTKLVAVAVWTIPDAGSSPATSTSHLHVKCLYIKNHESPATLRDFCIVGSNFDSGKPSDWDEFGETYRFLYMGEIW